MKKRIKLLLIIIWMIIIFLFSNETALNSGNRTINVIDKTSQIVTGNKLDDTNKDSVIDKIFKPVRKSAHFFIYFILGILILSYVREFNLSYKRSIMITISFCFLYAISDEIHQLFVEGRTSKFTDVLIDTSGSLFGVFLYYLGYRTSSLHLVNKKNI